MSDQVAHLTEADWAQAHQAAGDKPVFVDFYAEWCGPCKMAAPVIEKLGAEYKDKAVIVKVDVDEANGLAQKYNVRSIPTVLVFKHGEPITDGTEPLKIIGFQGEQGYRQLLDKALAS